MITPAHKVDALWFEQGTAADAAAAINATRGRIKHVSARMVAEHWKEAQRLGRLPPTIVRPANGFPPGPLTIVKRFIELYGRAA